MEVENFVSKNENLFDIHNCICDAIIIPIHPNNGNYKVIAEDSIPGQLFHIFDHVHNREITRKLYDVYQDRSIVTLDEYGDVAVVSVGELKKKNLNDRTTKYYIYRGKKYKYTTDGELDRLRKEYPNGNIENKDNDNYDKKEENFFDCLEYVVFVVVPQKDNNNRRKADTALNILRDCYYKAFKELLDCDGEVDTIGFPLIGTGILGFDYREARQAVESAIKIFQDEYTDCEFEFQLYLGTKRSETKRAGVYKKLAKYYNYMRKYKDLSDEAVDEICSSLPNSMYQEIGELEKGCKRLKAINIKLSGVKNIDYHPGINEIKKISDFEAWFDEKNVYEMNNSDIARAIGMDESNFSKKIHALLDGNMIKSSRIFSRKECVLLGVSLGFAIQDIQALLLTVGHDMLDYHHNMEDAFYIAVAMVNYRGNNEFMSVEKIKELIDNQVWKKDYLDYEQDL